MNRPGGAFRRPVSSGELCAALEHVLRDHFSTLRRIARLERRPSAHCTSFTIEELDIHFDDGTTLQLVFKDVSQQALLEGARQAKPAFLYDPLREIETYRTILAPRLGTATCYGTVVDQQSGRYWLFLERVPGVELYRVGNFATWQQVACWLAMMHTHFAGETERLMQTAPLLHYNADFYRLWPHRAQEVLRQTSQSEQTWQSIERLTSRYDAAIDRLVKLPLTFLHGEFYASNVMVQEQAGELRVCPVDWEMAAVGTGLLDLAALTGGRWTKEEREALALTYWTALPPNSRWPSTPNMFLEALTCCHLHLALQWLGWSSEWTPPPEQRQDWLGEALRCAEEVGL